MPLFCSSHILTSSVIYYLTEALQYVIYLFYIIKRQIMQNFVCFNRKRVEQIHFDKLVKIIAIWRNLLWIKFIGCFTNQHILIGSERYAAVKLEASASSVITAENQSKRVQNWVYCINETRWESIQMRMLLLSQGKKAPTTKVARHLTLPVDFVSWKLQSRLFWE